jgi:competence protein ComEA
MKSLPSKRVWPWQIENQFVNYLTHRSPRFNLRLGGNFIKGGFMRKTLCGIVGVFCLKTALAAVDLNSASAEEIAAALNGVGKVKAEAIVEERTKNGPFKDLNEVAERVKGIAPATLEKNKDNIVLGASQAQASEQTKPKK